MDRDYNETMKTSVAVIPKGMTIVGNIDIQEELTIYGEIQGNVESRSCLYVGGSIVGDIQASELRAKDAYIEGNVNASGDVMIQQNSVVLGDVTADGIIINGALQGKIDVKNQAILGQTAIVDGDVKSKTVQIETGAVISGRYEQVYAAVSPEDFFKDKAPVEAVKKTEDKAAKEAATKKEGTTRKKR